MGTLWFVLVALLIVTYVVLDGFDLGAGIIHLWAARKDYERQMILRAIGPVWDGNEVWLLAGGGTLYFAFPQLYASSFSGFYLPLMMVLWLLMLRGIGIEFRNHVEGPVWQKFFDALFSVSSMLLAVFFGAAIGNVVRGVPLGPDGYFFEPLWTNFRIGPHPGILDWYSVLIGLLAFAALTSHGALYVSTKTEGSLQQRAHRTAAWSWWSVAILTVLSLVASLKVRPTVIENFRLHPWGWAIPVIVLGSLFAMFYLRVKQNDRVAFVASSVYLASMLGGAAFALYPNVLPSSARPELNLTIQNTLSGSYGLRVGLAWWLIGVVLALGYYIYLFRLFRGKVTLPSEKY